MVTIFKGRLHSSRVRSNMTYESETRSLLVEVGLKFERAEMQMDVQCLHERQKDKGRIGRLVTVEPVTTVIRSGRLRWYGHVMRNVLSLEFKAEDQQDMARESRSGYGRT